VAHRRLHRYGKTVILADIRPEGEPRSLPGSSGERRGTVLIAAFTALTARGGGGRGRVECGVPIIPAPADHVRPASRTRALAARLPASRSRGGVPCDRRAARHAPLPPRCGRSRAAAAPVVGGASGAERRLHA